MEPMDKGKITRYLTDRGIFDKDAVLGCVDILAETNTAEGYVNNLFAVEDKKSGKSVVVKQVMPYMLALAKETGEKRTFSMDRLTTETRVLTFYNTLYPGIAPEIYAVDADKGIIVMEDLSRLNLLRFDLVAGKTWPDAGKLLGAFLAGQYFFTSDHMLSPDLKARMMAYFDSAESKRLSGFLFEECVLVNKDKPMEPETDETRRRILANAEIKQAVSSLKDHYLKDNECLCHNDLHTSNILIGEDAVKIIDMEFSGYASIFMDLGRLASSFIINYVSWLGMPEVADDERWRVQEYDLQMLCDLFDSFRLTLQRLWQTCKTEGAFEETFHRIFCDSIRCAVVFTPLRMTSDMAQSCDIRRIAKREDLAFVQKRSLEIAEYALLYIDTFPAIADFCEFLRCCAAIERQ